MFYRYGVPFSSSSSSSSCKVSSPFREIKIGTCLNTPEINILHMEISVLREELYAVGPESEDFQAR